MDWIEKSTSMFLFPLYIKLSPNRYIRLGGAKDHSLVKAPVEQIYYVLASNGLYQRKIGPFFETLVRIWGHRARKLSWFGKEKEMFVLKLPQKLDVQFLLMAISFFRKQWKKELTEAVLLIYWDRARNGYELYCPEQMATTHSLKYDLPATKKDMQRVGTIHSHGRFGAFHSDTDCLDEEHEDGLHITIGRILSPTPAIVASLVVDGRRKEFKIDEIFEGIFSKMPDYEVPKEWLERVKRGKVGLLDSLECASNEK